MEDCQGEVFINEVKQNDDFISVLNQLLSEFVRDL